MKPIWAIQANAVDAGQARAVKQAVLDYGGRVMDIDVFPSTNTIISSGDYTNPIPCNIIPYGSTALVEMAHQRGWKGVFRNDNFSVPVWMKNRRDMLNGDSQHMTVADLMKFMRGFDSDKKLFIRPLDGVKAFTGCVFTVGELRAAKQSGMLGRFTFPEELSISVAEPKIILHETRWFIVNGRVIDGAVFRARGGVGFHIGNTEEIAEAQALADIWLPHETCVMDVVNTFDGEFVGEFNKLNSSGFYHHDIPKIVAAVMDGWE